MSNPVTFKDLFDFSKDSEVNKAIKTLEKAVKVYDDLVESVVGQKGEFTQAMGQIAKSTNEVTKSIQTLDTTTDKGRQEIAETNKAAKELSNTYESLKGKVVALEGTETKLRKERTQVNEKAKESIRLEKEREKLIARLNKATSKEAQENEKLRQRLNQVNRERKEAAKETLGQISLYQKEQARVKALANNYRELSLRYGQNSKQAKTAKLEHDKLRNSLLSVDNSLKSNRSGVTGLTSAMKGLSGILAGAGVVLGFQLLVRLGGNLINIFKGLSKENSTLSAILGKTKTETEALQRQQLQLGKSTEFTATQVAKAQIELARLGQTEQSIIDLTPGILAAATSLQTDLASAATLVAGQLNAFNLEANEGGRVADVLAKATQISAFNFSKLETALGIVSPAASAVNATLEDTLAILTAAVDANIDASTAATGLRNIFIDLSDKGITWNEAIDQINGSTDRLATANELFGKRGAVVASVIADNTEKINENRTALENAAGTAQRFATQELDNLEGDIKLLTSAWEGFVLGIERGDGVINNFIRGTLQGLTKLLGLLTSELEAGLDPLEAQRIEFVSITNALTSLNLEEEERLALINKLNTEYKEFLPSLITEKTTKEELISIQKAVNDQILQTILLREQEAKLQSIAQTQLQFAKEILDLQTEQGRIQQQNIELNKEADAALAAGNIGRLRQIDEQIKGNEQTIAQIDEQIERLRLLKEGGVGAVASITAEYERLKNELGIINQELETSIISSTKTATDEMKELKSKGVEPVAAELEEVELNLKKVEQQSGRTFTKFGAFVQNIKFQLQGTGQQIKEAFIGAFTALEDFLAAQTQKRIEQNELRIQELEEERDRELRLAGDNAQARFAIEQNFSKKIQVLEDRNRKEKTKAARREKAVRIAQSIIDTAAAAVKALPNVPLSIIIGAIGAAKTALIAATPVPAFAKGTDSAPSGPKLVGEKGRELVITPDKKMFLTSNRAEVRTDIPEGSQILTNSITENILRNAGSVIDRNESNARKIRDISRSEKYGIMRDAISHSIKMSNDQVRESFESAIKNLPEIHQFLFSDGQLKKNIRRGNVTYEDVKNRNSF